MNLKNKTQVKGFDIYGEITWNVIGAETGFPFEEYDGKLHHIHGYDEANQTFMSIGEVVGGKVVEVFNKYLIGKQEAS